MVLLGIILCLAVPAQAQSAQEMTSGTAYMHHYARPGHATISVYIWGAVGAPGTWRVEPEVDLIELLSAVRVPGTGQSEARTKRNTFVRIYRKEAGERTLVYEIQLDALLTQQSVYPTLRDHDILQVETISKGRFHWRDISAIVGTVSSILLLALRLSDL
jgi:hypothetical protein